MPSGNQERTYFDYNAGAPLLECARSAMTDAMSVWGNPSSVHREGREARKLVEDARRRVADLADVLPGNVIFTSSATEAAVHALSPVMRAGSQEMTVSALLVGATEHPCILGGGRFNKDRIFRVPVHKNGLLDLESLDSALANHDFSVGVPLVAVQLANNETGVIQPVRQISELVHSHGGVVVVDAVQALGKVPFSMRDTGADLAIVSSHKIGGPKGAGALLLADGSLSPKPLLPGGGQENYHRGGTENVAAIAGFGAACGWHAENLTKSIKNYALRDSIEDGISTISLEVGNEVAQPVFFGKSEARLGNTSCFAVAGIKAETALVALDLDGVAVSSGSACSSGKVKKSHVLDAMGAEPAELDGALRISVGWDSDEKDASRFLNAWKTIVGRLAA